MNSSLFSVICRVLLLRRRMSEVLFAGAAVALFHSPPPRAQTPPSPLSKTYVDTLIQRAFYNFNEAVSLTNGQEARLMEAISGAKAVCGNLKRKAKGDPNERYILWKVGELENHIILEERDLVLKRMRRGAQKKNNIINAFNAELARGRPDFSKLEGYHTRMVTIDRNKAAELRYSIQQRGRNLSTTITNAMENAVIRGDMASMRSDMAYVTTNDRHLSVPLEKYRRLERKLKARANRERLKAELDERLARASLLTDDDRFAEAWTVIQQLQEKIARARTQLEPRTAYRFDVEIGNLAERINTKEDSLMEVNLRVLREEGPDQAIDYLDKVLRECGVSLLKVARVDSAIIAVAGPQRGIHDDAIERELGELTRHSQTGDFTLESARQLAARKIQQRADSLRAIA
ncbi:MAG: hypothetical protein GF344_09540, partial [Chitinivibrionales bacterium]|nr:hypothetical protein [Chitinivibrionales bacterium]MBD3357084.1 hypothetical protein [Chitinivibrionales bacterium]